MRMYYALPFILFWCISFAGHSQVNTEVDSIQLMIAEYNETDSALFIDLIDTISYLAGRDSERALKLAILLEEQSNGSRNAQANIGIYAQIAQLYFLKGMADSSRTHIELGMEVVLAENDSFGMMSFYYLKAWLNQEEGQLEAARKAYYEGLEIAEQTKNYEQQMKFLGGLAISNSNDLDLADELKYLYQAKEIGEAHNLTHVNTYLNTLYNLAGTLQQNNKTDTAIIIYNELTEIYKANNYVSGLASIANNMSHIYRKKKDYPMALQKIKEALNYDRVTGTSMYIVGDMISIGKIYTEINQADSAIFYYQQADSISQASGLLSRSMEITKNIAEVYAANNRFEDAFYALQKNIAARDSFNIVETNKKLKELDNKYKIKEKDQENKLLRVESEKDDKIIVFQLLLMILLLIIISAVISLLVTRKKKQKQIVLLNDKLLRSNKELHLANTTKDKFFSVISHDLRGPIGNTKNLLDAITEDTESFTKQEMANFLSIAAKELGKTFNLLENLLTWARTQFGSLQCAPQKIDPCLLVEETVEPLVLIARNKQINITTNVKDCNTIFADKEMLSFIIRNLVTNAIKFTPENGEVAINGYKQENQYLISVSDNGVGMSALQLQDIFKIEENNSTKGTNNEPGTGLGLVLCKEFADINKIDIKVKSSAEKGSTFTLFINDSI